MSFQQWLSLLHFDAAKNGYTKQVGILGESVLQVFWESGCKPTINALLDDCERSRAA